MIDWSSINLPFSVNDLLSSAVGLLGILGPFLLLGLSFLLVPIIVYLIKMAFDMKKEREMNYGNPNYNRSYFDAVKADIWEDKLYGVRQKFNK